MWLSESVMLPMAFIQQENIIRNYHMQIKFLAAAVLLSTSLTSFAMHQCGDDMGTCFEYRPGGGPDTQQPLSCNDCCNSTSTGDYWKSSAGINITCQNTPPFKR